MRQTGFHVNIQDSLEGNGIAINEIAFFDAKGDRVPFIQSTKTANRDSSTLGEKCLIDGDLETFALYENGAGGVNFKFDKESDIVEGKIILGGKVGKVPRMITIYLNNNRVFQVMGTHGSLSDDRMMEFTFVCDNEGHSNVYSEKIIIDPSLNYHKFTGDADVYSTEETLTNKIFKGKPVYRKLVEFSDLSHFANDNNKWKVLDFGIENLDLMISANSYGASNSGWGTHGRINYSRGFNAQFRSHYTNGAYHFVASLSNSVHLRDVNFIVEYTKTTD